MRRERDENDERQVRVFLTTEGRALREKALAIPLAVGAALDGEREAIDTLRDGLHRLRERLDGDLGV